MKKKVVLLIILIVSLLGVISEAKENNRIQNINNLREINISKTKIHLPGHSCKERDEECGYLRD